MKQDNEKFAKLIPLIAIMGAIAYLIWLFTQEPKEKPEEVGRADTYTTTTSSSNEPIPYEQSKTCSWCGNSFSGPHYSQIIGGSCITTNDKTSIGKYCSQKCCSESKRK